MTSLKLESVFARQVLWERNLQIWKGNDEKILEYPFEERWWELSELETKFVAGTTLIDNAPIRKIYDYSELRRMGWAVEPRRVTVSRFRGQKVEYIMVRGSSVYDLGDFPPKHFVEVDGLNNRIRLLGPNALQVDYQLAKRNYMRRYGDHYSHDLRLDSGSVIGRAEEMLKQWSPETFSEAEFISVPEIPLAISDDGLLVCIEEDKDNPNILICGERRMGKSLTMHALLDYVHWKWRKPVINTNDIVNETTTWCLPWEKNHPFTYKLKLVGVESRPLPMVYLMPKTRTSQKVPFCGEAGFEISMPFRDAMLDYENFLKGKDNWTFRNCLPYFKKLLFDEKGRVRPDGLFSIRKVSDVDDIVDEELATDDYRGSAGVREKVKNVLKDMLNENFFDMTTHIPSKWTVRYPDSTLKDWSPWIVCSMAGLVPSIMTSNLRHQPYYPQYFKHILSEIFRFQTEDPFALKNKTEYFVFMDEILGIFSTVKENEFYNQFESVVRESGPARIGMVYNAQNVERVPAAIKMNTGFVISFHQKGEQAKALKQDFDLPSSYEKQLTKLHKFEAIMATSKYFVTYDRFGNREEVSEPICGTVLPSVSRHKAPKE